MHPNVGTDFSKTLSSPSDETINGATVKHVRSTLTGRTGTLPRTTAVVDVDIPLGNVSAALCQVSSLQPPNIFLMDSVHCQRR